MVEGIPPGRAGRLWLEDRLGHARRALDLLDRKRRVLRLRVHEAARVRDRALESWRQASAEAQRAGLAARALAGTWTVRVASEPVRDRAAVAVAPGDTVGVRHPGRPSMELPQLPTAYQAACGPAVCEAAAAHRAALEAAAQLAVGERTFQLLRAELQITERRYRAVERVRLPALQRELQLLNLRLDELERQERITTRWASGQAGRGPDPAGRHPISGA
ncbi:MAG TPA: V-type ATP synthase subunit D [Acidimicrobiales bacterium]|nr:V-type ATP synthase subunit D [Acidimicrobiales bacterium]